MAGCQRRETPSLALPGRVSASDPAAAQAVLEELRAAADGRTTATIEISESAANSLVAPYLAGAPIDGLTLWFEPGQILARVRLNWRGDHIILATAEIAIVDGQPLISLTALHVDGVAIPRWIRASVAYAASDALTDATLPVNIEQVTLREGVLILTIGP